MKKFGSTILAAGLVLAGTSAFALNTTGRITDTTRASQTSANESAARRALREDIRAKQSEYKELRRTNDPRAEQSRRELESLKSEWTRLYGNDEAAEREGKGTRPPHRGWNGEGHGKAKGHAKHEHKSK